MVLALSGKRPVLLGVLAVIVFAIGVMIYGF